MVTPQGLLLVAALLVVHMSICHGFWYLSSSNPTPSPAKRLPGPPPPPPGMQPAYSLRSEQFAPWPNQPLQYMADGPAGMTVALPVAVSVQPQTGPPPPTLRGTLHDVQLVPCLCPVSNVFKDYDPSAIQGQPPQHSVSYSQATSSASNTP